MKILIFSDNHGKDANMITAMNREKPFDMLIHLGDGLGLEYDIDKMCNCFHCMVSGNSDFMTQLNTEVTLPIGKTKAFITHGHRYSVKQRLDYLVGAAYTNKCTIAMYGHTHMPSIEIVNGIMTINPGSISYPRQPGRVPSYAVMMVDNKGEYNCEIKYIEEA